MDLQGKRVMVLGLARTGVAAARFLAGQGAEVLAADRRGESELARETAALAGLPVRYFLGGEEPAWLDGVDLVIPSPGVAPENPLVRAAEERGIEILCEIELGYRFVGAPLVAITGTNGKSTTTSLDGAMLQAAGLNVIVGGNIC